MSNNFIIFHWVSDYIREEILQLLPENYTKEQLEDIEEDLRYELRDMNLQIKTVKARAELNNNLHSEEYLDWVERINTRLRIKSVIHGAFKYNLRKIQQIESNSIEKRLDSIEGKLKYFQERDVYYQRLDEKIENIKKEIDKQLGSFKNKNHNFHKEYQKQRSFILRCLYHLLVKTNNDTDYERDYEHMQLENWLSFIPAIMEKDSDFGKFSD